MIERAPTIGDVMTPSPKSIRPRASVSDALRMMRSLGVRHLVVSDEATRGVVTDADLELTGLAGVDPTSTPVEQAMVPDPYRVAPNTPLRSVVKDMVDKHLGAVLVTGTSGDVIGIFTTTDALRAFGELLVSGSL